MPQPLPSGMLDATTLAMLDHLVVQSHWNQIAADWQLFAREGRIQVLRSTAGRIVASGAVMPMGERDAWISMILVDPIYRAQGLGSRIFSACLQDIEGLGRRAWLDATPAGEPLYQKFGFRPLWRLSRWQRGPQPRRADALPINPQANPQAIASLAALDAEALGFARPALLQDLATREGSQLIHRAQSFAIVRQGRVAQHIGPLIATHEAEACALLRHIAHSLEDTLFIDVPDARPQMRHALEREGFSQQRPFTRMVRSNDTAQGHTHFIHAIAGPEYG